MERELKIAELAALWNVSVPTCWNRIKKERLTTVIKKDESNKDVNYVSISDEIINKYVVNEVNNLYKDVNNGYYEDLLTVNNVNNPETPIKSTDFIKDIINLNKGYNEELKTVYNDYNDRLQRLTDELIDYKSKVPLLEDRANREGLYLKEIDELKKENKHNKILIKVLTTLLITLIMFIMMYITYFITVDNLNNAETKKPSIEQVSTVENVDYKIPQSTKVNQVEVKPVKRYKKR